jgi:hypothetical protein
VHTRAQNRPRGCPGEFAEVGCGRLEVAPAPPVINVERPGGAGAVGNASGAALPPRRGGRVGQVVAVEVAHEALGAQHRWKSRRHASEVCVVGWEECNELDLEIRRIWIWPQYARGTGRSLSLVKKKARFLRLCTIFKKRSEKSKVDWQSRCCHWKTPKSAEGIWHLRGI